MQDSFSQHEVEGLIWVVDLLRGQMSKEHPVIQAVALRVFVCHADVFAGNVKAVDARRTEPGINAASLPHPASEIQHALSLEASHGFEEYAEVFVVDTCTVEVHARRWFSTA